ncbi:isoleucine--tRNA ligase, mitochondrial isoform X1 [Leguminivora glycinivorella]|uniref:isoleucine--tRNA ligase, mitochondrial isoform X1 n=1 Tax=Leguminivora glycinivorella TaxID=1035111 RepID=UPI00200DC65B|nr:isoleucine--tRNA ligase, mitochondrial isoform X1 [Leguminivora glycinivorella]
MLCTRNLNVFPTNYKKTITKWVPIGLTRMKSSVEPKTKTYSHTILFPKTDFPARSNSARKDEIQKVAKFSDLYNWQREHLKGPEFVLHDGPPYANGDLHMGHAINKIIKDINNRHHVLLGDRVHYVPGWDCHGLPIELKALQQTKKTKTTPTGKGQKLAAAAETQEVAAPSSAVEIRRVARKFALETIERQKAQFESWGVMADWDKRCYRTLDNSYVKSQLELFYEMYEKGLIFRALKPVYWSPSSKTALAEAELEYDPQFKSTEVYVSFPLDTVPDKLRDVANNEVISAVVWTTTPWTLVANRAICFSGQLSYSVVRMEGRSGLFLLATELLDQLEKTLEGSLQKVAEVAGRCRAGGRALPAPAAAALVPAPRRRPRVGRAGHRARAHRPRARARRLPGGAGAQHTCRTYCVLYTTHVILYRWHSSLTCRPRGAPGSCTPPPRTGPTTSWWGWSTTYLSYVLRVIYHARDTLPLALLAHVSAARGTGLVHTAPAHGPDDFLVGLEHNIPVECNVDESGRYCNLDALNGLDVLGRGQEAVIALLGDQVLRRGVHTHSYPLDWRTKEPVILRASHQWFINTEALKEKALEALEKVQILPSSTAPQSRQGFKARIESRPYWCVSRQRAWGVPIPCLYHRDTPILDKRIIERLCHLLEERGPDAWWTADVSELLPGDLAQELQFKAEDVTKGEDIMDIWLDSGSSWRGLPHQAALYSEGVDQLTGWFQSSLLTSAAATGRAPYKCIFVHGFVVDADKRKMSKSLGNVIAPEQIISGGGKQPAYGVDTLRWWVASHGTQHTQIVVSKKLLEDCAAEVGRIRAILRYLLGVIDLRPPTNPPRLNYLDRYMLAETYKFLNDLREHMKELRYNSAVQNILYFISNKVSALYCHCVKDRLYCAPKDSPARIGAQLVAHTILVSLCKAIGPILPHLIEEVWRYHPLYEKPFFFTQNIPVLENQSVDTTIMDLVLELKKDITALTKNENLKKFSVDVKVNPSFYPILNDLNSVEATQESVLSEILEVSLVSVSPASVSRWELRVDASAQAQCLRCRRYNAEENSDKCVRCQLAMDSM